MIKTPSIIRLRNLKTQLCFYGKAYRPHESVTKTVFVTDSWRDSDHFRKRYSKQRNLKMPTLRFSENEKTVWERSFSKAPAPVFLKQKSKRSADCCVFKIFRRSVDWAWETVIPVVTIVCSKRDGRELELNLRWEHKKRKRLKCESRRFQQVGSLIPWYPVSTETRW